MVPLLSNRESEEWFDDHGLVEEAIFYRSCTTSQRKFETNF
jgi:hypothetical protein